MGWTCYIYRQGSAEYFGGFEFQKFVIFFALGIGALFFGLITKILSLSVVIFSIVFFWVQFYWYFSNHSSSLLSHRECRDCLWLNIPGIRRKFLRVCFSKSILGSSVTSKLFLGALPKYPTPLIPACSYALSTYRALKTVLISVSSYLCSLINTDISTSVLITAFDEC